MQFVKTESLKMGMRLARPIYNKDGVLLYERNSKLTYQGMKSIKNFGLIGIYILEPAEPVPPMSAEDIEFERFQTMSVFAIKEELGRILHTKKAPKIQVIASNIIKNYGRLDHKINFPQNLRSKEDYIYKHSLNVAMLCAMITRTMNSTPEEQLETVLAALVHDIGKLTVSEGILEKDELTEQEKVICRAAESKGHDLLEMIFSSNLNIKRICAQSRKALLYFKENKKSSLNLVQGARVLMVAETFDSMTSMSARNIPQSEIAAIRLLKERTDIFDKTVVDALIQSINLLEPGLAVELSTGQKALIIQANYRNILYPTVLTFLDNQVIDLSNRENYGDLEIRDVMKTMDNRYVIEASVLEENGFLTKKPETESSL